MFPSKTRIRRLLLPIDYVCRAVPVTGMTFGAFVALAESDNLIHRCRHFAVHAPERYKDQLRYLGQIQIDTSRLHKSHAITCSKMLARNVILIFGSGVTMILKLNVKARGGNSTGSTVNTYLLTLDPKRARGRNESENLPMLQSNVQTKISQKQPRHSTTSQGGSRSLIFMWTQMHLN